MDKNANSFAPPCLNNQKGFGLIEMMVTLVITMIGILATMTVVKTQSQANVANRAQSGASVLGSDVRLQLSRRATCLPSFVAAPTAWTGVQNVSLQVGTNQIAPGQGQNYGLRINSLRLTNWTSMGLTSSGRNLHASDLVLGASSVKWGSDSSEEHKMNDRNIARVIFEVNPDNSIFGCYGVDPETDLGNLLELACTSVGGTFAAGTNTCTPKSSGRGECSTAQLGLKQGPNWYEKSPEMQDIIPPGFVCMDKADPSHFNQAYDQVPASERSQYEWKCPQGYAFYGSSMGFIETKSPETSERPSDCVTNGKFVTPTGSGTGRRIPAGVQCYNYAQGPGHPGSIACGGGMAQVVPPPSPTPPPLESDGE